jgi:DNA adenine methylase
MFLQMLGLPLLVRDNPILEQVPSDDAGGAEPFLRWAGSKRKLIARLARYWSMDYRRYIEPFVGSACLFFGLGPKKAILGDINRDLIETYRQIRHCPDDVFVALHRLKKGKAEYIRLRSTDPALLPPIERAARFIYLNRFCFNGLYRTNRHGSFNVPYGADRSGDLPSREALTKCAELLQRAQLVAGDFELVLNHVGRDDFVYLDPPFSVKARRVFKEYGPSVFGPDDVDRLETWLRILSARGAAFLVSYADSAEARRLSKHYHVRFVAVQRNIAGFSKDRVRARELLISNRAPIA